MNIENDTIDAGPDGAPEQPMSLADAAAKAHAELSAADTDSGGPESRPAPGTTPAAGAAAAPAPFELPGYAQRWNEPARNALTALGNAVHNRAHLDPILAQLEQTSKYITDRDMEFARFRQQYEPIGHAIAQVQQQWALNGMTPAQGIAQLVEYQNFIASNPDGAFPHLAAAYRPNEPGKALAALAKAWGVDPAAMSHDQPWIDPTIAAVVNPLQERLERLDQQQAHQEQIARQQWQNAVVTEIRSLQEAKDETGALRFPHFDAVFERMFRLGQPLTQAGIVTDIPSLYDFVVANDPELGKAQREAKAKAAEELARKEAAARTAKVRQERESTQTIAGKGQPAPGRARSIADAAAAAYDALEAAA